MILGAQFFTFREKCQTLEGLEETMKRVSDMGIKAIQLSGVCKYDPEWAAEKAAKYGLEIVLTHNPYENVVEKTDEIIDFHKKLCCKNIGIGTMPGWEITEEKYEKFKRYKVFLMQNGQLFFNSLFITSYLESQNDISSI